MADPTNVNGLLGLDINRQQMLKQGTPQTLADASRNRGEQIGRDLGGLLGGLGKGVVGAVRGGGLKAIGAGVKEGERAIRTAEDAVIAEQLGITPDEFKARQELKRKIGEYEPTAEDPMDAQIETLEMAMKSAVDPEIKGRIAQQLQALQGQRAELKKLEHDTAVAEAGETQNIKVGDDVFAARVDPVTGIAYGPDGTPYTDFKLLPKTGAGGSLRKTINNSMTRSEQGALRTAIVDSRQALRQFGKVMANMKDAFESDGGVTYLGRPVQATFSFMDQWSRHINNIARVAGVENPFTDEVDPKYAGVGGQKRYAREIVEQAQSSDKWNEFIKIPKQFQTNAAAASRYRANIMTLAYMEARATEPSNRGLSDKDIEAALNRLEAWSGNPQAIMRNFGGKVVEQARAFEDRIEALPEVEGAEPEDVLRSIVGRTAADSYRSEFNNFKDTFNISEVDEFGRLTMDEPIDADVGPGEGPGSAAERIEKGAGLTTEQSERLERLKRAREARQGAQ